MLGKKLVNNLIDAIIVDVSFFHMCAEDMVVDSGTVCESYDMLINVEISTYKFEFIEMLECPSDSVIFSTGGFIVVMLGKPRFLQLQTICDIVLCNRLIMK